MVDGFGDRDLKIYIDYQDLLVKSLNLLIFFIFQCLFFSLRKKIMLKEPCMCSHLSIILCGNNRIIFISITAMSSNISW